jgi:hypothetical protein
MLFVIMTVQITVCPPTLEMPLHWLIAGLPAAAAVAAAANDDSRLACMGRPTDPFERIAA